MPQHVNTPLGRFLIYDEGTITRDLVAGAWWDDHIRPILDEAPKGWALDLGAHFGWFTIYLAHTHERVLALEPYPPSYALLEHNIRVEHPRLADQIVSWPVAAYDRCTTLQFAPGNPTGDEAAFGFTPGTDGLTVPALALDPYLVEAPITCIKCDVQGADLRALTGLQETIRRCRPIIAFEWEDGMARWQGDLWEHVLTFFEGLNYTVDRIVPDYWDYVARPR